jgi:DHA1 family multidrug resistance protein-like MFS transporter
MRGLYIVAAVTMAGVSSVFALLAEIEDTYGIPERHLGWIAGSSFVGALVTQLWLSRYADRGHAVALLRGGVVAAAVGLLWFGLATELWQFVAGRTLLGAGVGMIVPPARRYIIVNAGARQGQQLGAFYGAYLSGFVFGPPIAGALTELFDLRVPFFLLGACSLATLVALRGLDIPATRTGGDGTQNKRVLLRLIRSRRMVAALLVVVSFRYSIGVFEPLWAPHLNNLGASTMVITLSLTTFALPMLLVARWAGSLSDRYGPRISSLLSALATVPMMSSYGFLTSVPLLFAISVCHGLCEAVQSPGTQAAVSDAAPVDDAAAAQGLGEAAGSVAAMVGALTAAPLFDWLGAGPAWLIGGMTMLALLTTSQILDPVQRKRPEGTRAVSPAGT